MTGTDGHGCSWRLPMVTSEIQDIDDEVGRGWLLQAMKEYSKGRLPAAKVKPVGDGIMEITVNRGGFFLRCLFYHPMPFIAVGLKVYMKKSNRLPKQHLETAKARRKSWDEG
ncbi:type II toxin-antitoxin system RelE/ParE family toxin [Nostocoides australiense]